ncbi:MAG: flagellar protein FlaG [Firmicutes bacterium]|nr:flagellar protein FlaG [Bacillota bacterium]
MKVDLGAIAAPNGMNAANGNPLIKRLQPDNPLSDEQTEVYAGAESPKKEVKNINETLEIANKAFKEVNVAFRYYIDKKTNREIVEIVNAETGEKIRQIPPEEIINMLSRMYDLLGILVDLKA